VTGTVRAAAIRRRIQIPLRFGDGYSTMTTVVSFTGLTDGQQHVALELGRPATAGLYDKLDAYALQDRGLDTYDANLALGHLADERDYTSAAQMLHALGANRIELLSNNPDKGAQLARLGITIARQVPTGLHLTGTNAAYLATKARRGGHDLLRRGLDRAAGPRPQAGPAHLGAEGR